MRKNKVMLLIVSIIAVCLTAFVVPASAEEKAPAQAPAPAEMNFKNVDSLVILFITKPEVLRELVPKPLVPNEWDMMFLVIERTKSGEINFNHMILGVPVGYRGKMYSFYVARIVNSEEISAQSQASSGYKIPVGRVSFEKKEGKVKGLVEMDGRVLASTDVVLGKPGDPLDVTPGVLLVDRPPDTKQLVWGTQENVKIHQTFDGTTELKLNKPIPGSTLDIPVLAVFRGVYRSMDLTLKLQGVLYDYMKKKASQN